MSYPTSTDLREGFENNINKHTAETLLNVGLSPEEAQELINNSDWVEAVINTPADDVEVPELSFEDWLAAR